MNEEQATDALPHRREEPASATQSAPVPSKKDLWDRLGVLTTLVNVVVVGGLGLWLKTSFDASQARSELLLKQQQMQLESQHAAQDDQRIRMARMELIHKFMPMLKSSDQEDREFAFEAMHALGETALAAKLARVIKGSGATQAMRDIASGGTETEKRIATDALSALEKHVRSNTDEVTALLQRPGGSRLGNELAKLAVAEWKSVVGETGPNRGEAIDTYVSTVGLNPNGQYTWSAAFVYFLSTRLSSGSPLPKSGGCLSMWARAKSEMRRNARAGVPLADVPLPEKGDIFFIDHGAGKGHCGIVIGTDDGQVMTIEGNASVRGFGPSPGDAPGRDGVVFKKRSLASINVGFLHLSP